MEEEQYIGRYKVIETIGQGAMGAVVKCFDPNLRRYTAIKTIHRRLQKGKSDSQSFKDRFFREAHANSQLNHPNIVGIYDSDLHLGEPYLVMEFIEGKTLDKLVAEKPDLSIQVKLSLLVQMAAGLDFAHRKGIIHRDIKPANILITPEMQAKIVDFGLARLKDSTLTMTGVFLGTPSYASPEQIFSGKLDDRSDIFSFGILAFELLFGKRPFGGENLNSILYHIANSPPDLTFTGLPEGVDHAELSQIFSGVLSKDPTKRPPTTRNFVAQLAEALGHRGLVTLASTNLDHGSREQMLKNMRAAEKAGHARAKSPLPISKPKGKATNPSQPAPVPPALVPPAAVAPKGPEPPAIPPGSGAVVHQESRPNLGLALGLIAAAVLILAFAGIWAYKRGYILSGTANGESVQPGAGTTAGIANGDDRNNLADPSSDLQEGEIEVPLPGDAVTSSIETESGSGKLDAGGFSTGEADTGGDRLSQSSTTGDGDAGSADRNGIELEKVPDLDQIEALRLTFMDRAEARDRAAARTTLGQLNALGADVAEERRILKLLDDQEKARVARDKVKREQALRDQLNQRFQAAQTAGDIAAMRLTLNNFTEQWPKDTATIQAWTKAIEQLRQKSLNRIVEVRLAFSEAVKKRDIQTAQARFADLDALGQVNPDDKAVLRSLEESEFVDPFGIKFIRINAGSYTRGNRHPKTRSRGDETLHKVTIRNDFYLSAYEITQEQWYRVMSTNPSKVKGGDLPVTNVSWKEVREFTYRLNEKVGAKIYRMPFEGEWEYACRAGADTLFNSGDQLNTSRANFKDSGKDKPLPVGSYPPNAWGLYDMHGNVWEWCYDIFEPYKPGPQTDPKGAAGTRFNVSRRALRGGSFESGEEYCASGSRQWRLRRMSAKDIGVRLLRTSGGDRAEDEAEPEDAEEQGP